jgi:hypothetical protein
MGRQGISRSVTLAYLLKLKGHDTLAVGMRRMGRDTRKMVMDWAELIILLHQKCQEGIPQEYWPKLKIWEVGRDVYFQEPHAGLVEMLNVYIEREKL